MATAEATADEIDPDTLDGGEPAWEVGRWYMWTAPGGFTFFGRYVRPLGYGIHRFAEVKHLRNAGQKELPEMCRSGCGPETVLTEHSFRYLDACPLWKAPWDAKSEPATGGRNRRGR